MGSSAILFTLVAVIVLLAGIALGYWVRANSARSEKDLLDQHNRELSDALNALRCQLTQSQAESAARAGYESLATERLNSLLERNTQLESIKKQLDEKDGEILRLARLHSKLETDLANEQGNAEQLTQQFKILANEILKENSKIFTEQNKDNLAQVLNPLTRDLTDFRLKVEAVEKESLVGRTELAAQLKGLESLNKKLSDEAHSLATALRRDTKAQGNWGEIILLDILENSGLKKGEHFTFQQSFFEESDGGMLGQRRQTDVVVKLPEGRHLIIDSKVSLNAYNDSVKAENEEERKTAIRSHLASVRKHYIELAGRNYHGLSAIQSPDFVVMFVPIEPAFMLAMQEDDGLWLDAYNKGVLLAGPTTILFVVRIVENLWRQEQQTRNVKDVMDRGAKLYEKFAAFINDMEDLGKCLRGARQSFEEAKKKLTGGRDNLVRQVEKLRELGVKPKFSKSTKPMPISWLASADVEDEALALAASDAEAIVESE
jgi:DNA recombination protein RmuC